MNCDWAQEQLEEYALGMLDAAEETAVSAGQLIRQKSSQPRQLTEKGFRDIVTDADLCKMFNA